MNTFEHIQDTLIHKNLVVDSSLILVDYLLNQGRFEDAIQLARRCARHDNSKLELHEMSQFLKLPPEKDTMSCAKKEMPEYLKQIIAIHWSHNRHHPEFFDDYHDMSELDIMEMVCDWHARSKQFKTNFLDFVMIRQEKRFQFDEDFFEKVLFYCKILDTTKMMD